ncbi:P63C domain-containing protein [Pseudomonas donghuensis]|uniref:P63C domain-containing protein n=1 Tax=Pseudomonas donghuensis TaxID=1163398 RepID=UPI0020C29644|nr:P63C domain-containing protein [Pseudomonas donghuensis]MCP6695890.1 P63C domain-containing protein [Pseudomonas donghuensis]
MKTDVVKGKAKGGVAAAEKMTKKERSDRAKKAASARWGLKATHKGNFLSDFGVDAECYVLNDEKKTAVMTQRGIAAALGAKNPGGNDFERLVSRKSLVPYVGAELLEKIAQPIEFKWVYPGANQLEVTIRGYSADVLIDVCNAILSADAAGKLAVNQGHLAIQARIIVNASAKNGITSLVYALAGYRPETDEVIQAFKAFVQEEARKYEQEFPSELYLAWHRLYQIPIPARGKPWKLMHLTRRHIYYPLAKSSGRILDLLRALRDKDPQKKKLFQFLNEIGTRAMRMHMGRVLEMAESSSSAHEYEEKFTTRFGGQQELALVQEDEEQVTN